jgi:hypothetical protein
MKNMLMILGLGALTVFSGPPRAAAKDTPATAEQLRGELETAIKARDTNAVLALVNWTGMTGEIKAETTQEMTGLAGTEVAAVKLLPLPADYQATNEMNGVRYFPNVRVCGLINVVFPQAGNDMQMPYGENGGAYYVAGMLQETFDAHPTKAVSLGVMVMGLFPNDHPGILKCAYVYLADRREKTGGFQCTNSWSTSFFGDTIKSCRVTKVSGEGSFELKIDEDGKTVFDSDMVETNPEIVYEKK